MLILWPLFLPIAAASGWWVGRRQLRGAKHFAARVLPHDYLVGLNYLLNEQHDKAIDIFIKLLSVNSETVEVHLALGSLFRKRGEVDRAIRIHQNLIARPQLSPQYRVSALMALGQDYLRAGVFDRAERVFQEIVNSSNNYEQQTVASLHNLLNIYQQEKSWDQAIQVAERLEKTSGEKMMGQVIAHHYCELAEIELDNKNEAKVLGLLEKALKINKKSARASLLQARLWQTQKNYKEAIHCYKRVTDQNPDFISEIIDPLVICYKTLSEEDALFEYLESLVEKHPRISIIGLLAEQIKAAKGIEAAADYMAEQLNRYPSIRGLQQLIEWHIATTYGKVRTKLEVLHALTIALLKDRPIYRCGHCGFSGRQLHWQCPSCKEWDVILPIRGLEGD